MSSTEPSATTCCSPIRRGGEDERWDALAASALRETVAGLAAGLDTPVGPGGEALAGGQRRRPSVAQGVLRRPAVLLLDEPTEGLDTATAGELLAAAITTSSMFQMESTSCLVALIEATNVSAASRNAGLHSTRSALPNRIRTSS